MEFDDGRSVFLQLTYRDDEPLIPEDWITDVAAIHPASENWICFAISDGVGGWTHKWCRGRDVICTLQRLKERPDFSKQNIYVSQLEFSERKRTVNSVAAMNVSFLDLDGKLAKNLTPEGWRDIVLEHCRRYAIPEPNDMVFTGNGIHIKWIYTQPTSRSRLERWNLIERLLYTQFEELGADAKSLDAARVLRVPGTFNCKPGTEDNRVRVVHHSPAVYTFEEFAEKVQASIPVNEENFRTQLAEFERSHEDEVLEIELAACFTHNSDKELEQLEGEWLLDTLHQHHPRDTWVNLSCDALGQSLWVQTYELHDTLEKLDFNQSWTIALSEFTEKSRAGDRLSIAFIPCNFVVLPRCPGATVEEKIENVKIHCRRYRDVGIQEPNQFLTVGDTLIAEWNYDKVLPGQAVSRWKATQEFICRHFECWGGMDDPDNLKPTASLPMPGFKDMDGAIVKLAYHSSETRYSFHELATLVLNFSQQAVKAYKVEKAEEKAQKRRDKKSHIRGNGDFAHIASRRYNDISHLLEMRKDSSGNVRQGYREKCVFWAMNFAIQAGEVTLLNFDAYAQSLIDFCGPRFRSECGVRVLTTLKQKLNKGEKTYFATDKKLIKDLGITEDEQLEMVTLRSAKPRKAKKERTPRQQWLEAHPQERTAPWKGKGVSRSKFFKDRKAAREAAEKERRWRSTQRKRMEKWSKAHKSSYRVKPQRGRLRYFSLRGQVSPYIMRGAILLRGITWRWGRSKRCRGP